MGENNKNSIDFVTLGCRLNAYETEVMRGHAQAAGLKDAVVINTCAVTGEAVRQAKQTIRKTRRDRPDAKIIVTGCAVQIDPDAFRDLEDVNHVIGNDDKMKAETFSLLSNSTSPKAIVNDIMSVRETANHMIDGFGNRARAYVQIQNGCDHRCTFCIIPFGRGPSRSVPAGDVVQQIQHLVDHGYREVVLTGVDITSYGGDLPGGQTLGTLVRQVLKWVPELERLRLSSIDQVEADKDLLIALGEEERLMPHLHLSMQAGSDMILKRMKRRHSRKDAIEFCQEAKRLRPDVVFGADLIAGFPTETDAMFEDTLSIVDACDLTYLHVFPFSPREGTPAARMPQLERSAIKNRAAQLRGKGDAALSTYLAGQCGKRVQALVEHQGRGRTPQFAEVEFSIENDAQMKLETGTIQNVLITGTNGRRLQGDVV